jgi:hypothetical protein
MVKNRCLVHVGFKNLLSSAVIYFKVVQAPLAIGDLKSLLIYAPDDVGSP